MATPVIGRPEMRGYGVPDSNDGALPWDWAEERLERCRNYFVATTRPDGRPHAMPVWGAWTDRLFVFSTAITSVKSENLKVNPAITITVEHLNTALVLEGEAFLAQLDEVPGFTDAYRKKYDYKIEEGPVWAVRPKKAFGFIEDDSFAETATRWSWER